MIGLLQTDQMVRVMLLPMVVAPLLAAMSLKLEQFLSMWFLMVL